MSFKCGIVGLPNVGKSTIFNALTASQVEAANYPFCTIEPNTGVVAVPDERLNVLAKINNSKKIIPVVIEFVDIAGLVKGASKGEGLGNQFLGHIRTVDAIIHVVRCFDDSNITHVHGSISPKRDIEVIEMELIFADLEQIEKRLDKVSKLAKGGDKASIAELSALNIAKTSLEKGIPVRLNSEFTPEQTQIQLLTSKPILYLANVTEEDAALDSKIANHKYISELYAAAQSQKCEVLVLSGKVEAEVAQLPLDERKEFLDALGLKNSGLDRLASSGLNLLNLITFFATGDKETHAWNCVRGSKAPHAAGRIHTDFEKGFIRAEIISYQDYVASGGEVGAREKGKTRIEGKDYVMQDGDIVHFRFNV
ncbi:MAG: redox-regulated ATPase YchF [Deltaproteobacteria bacterium]|jgi:GTP-binding protein YchF|nr:redox-regulated ATPase YchF [Deltaproteobacteria bacterium]